MLADVRTGALVKVAIVRGRTTLVAGDRVVDAERASGGGVPADPAATFTAWPSLLNIAAGLEQEGPGDAPELGDRVVQFEGGANPQFGLGKSAPGFGPIGPWVVSADELGATPQLDIRCDVDDETKQSPNTSHLIFDVPALVEYLSYRVRLRAGDLIFTGTPAGVGWSREPEELLHAGSRIDTTIGVIGTLTTRVVGR